MDNLSLNERLMEAYLNLQALNPRDALLEYLILSGDEFHINPNVGIKMLFIQRFRKEVRVQDYDKIEDYHDALWNDMIGNYTEALQKRIRSFIEG